MASLGASFIRPRKRYQKIVPATEHPYLIEIQKNSYKSFCKQMSQ